MYSIQLRQYVYSRMLVASGIESVNKNLNGSKPLMDHHQKMMKELASHYNYVTKQESYKDKLRKAFKSSRCM